MNDLKRYIFTIFFLICLNIFSQDYGTVEWEFLANSSILSTPSIESDGTIYFGGMDSHNLFAIDSDGNLKWEYKTNDGIFASPIIGKNGVIYIGCRDSFFYAVNPDGTLNWKFSTDNEIFSSAAISDNGIIYFGSTDRKLYALNSEGEKQWEFATGEKILSSPAISDDGTIYIGSNDSSFYAIDENGIEKWEYKTDGPIWFSSPAIGEDGNIYFTSDDSTLYALNKNGTLIWKYKLEAIPGNSPIIDEGGTIYIGSFANLLAISKNGILKWKYVDTGNFFSSCAIGEDGTIYIGTYGNGLKALNPDGSLKWRSDEFLYIESSPVIISDSLILIGSNSLLGKLTAIRCENDKYAKSSWPRFRHDNINSGNINTPITTDLENIDSELDYVLNQNYPNPFNPTTTIIYSIPSIEYVQLKVYDILGEEVAALVDEEKRAGNYEIQFNASELSSGVYFYSLKAGKYLQSNKMLILK